MILESIMTDIFMKYDFDSFSDIKFTEHNGEKYIVLKKNKKYGIGKLINDKIKIVVPIIYDEIDSDCLNSELGFAYAYVLRNYTEDQNLFGFYKIKDNEIIEPVYSGAVHSYVKSDYKIFEKDGKFGVVDRNFDIAINFEYISIDVSPNNIICHKKETADIYNKNAKFLVTVEAYSKTTPLYAIEFGNSIYFKELGTNYVMTNGIKEKTDYELIVNEFVAVENKFIIIKKGGWFGVVGRNQTIIVPLIYDEILTQNVETEMIFAGNNKKYQLYDFDGNLLSNTFYKVTDNSYFSGGLLGVEINGVNGYIDDKYLIFSKDRSTSYGVLKSLRTYKGFIKYLVIN